MPGGRGKIQEYFASLDSEGRRAQSAKGGKATAENKRKKKLLREYLEALLEAHNEGVSNYDRITIALVEKAMEGDVSAYKEIRSTLGQDPKQELELSSNDSIKINITGEEENE